MIVARFLLAISTSMSRHRSFLSQCESVLEQMCLGKNHIQTREISLYLVGLSWTKYLNIYKFDLASFSHSFLSRRRREMWLKFCWLAREWSFTKDQRREKNVSTETALFHSLGRIYWLIFSRFLTGTNVFLRYYIMILTFGSAD